MARPKRPTKAQITDVRKHITSLIGENAEEAFLLYYQVMKGDLSVPALTRDGEEILVKPSLDQRMEAAKVLIEYQHGKPTTKSEVSTTVVNEIDLSRLSIQELRALEEIANKTKAIDAESKVIQ